MKNEPQTTSRFWPKEAIAVPGILIVLVLLALSIPQTALAGIPLYAQDYESQLFQDSGISQYPDITALIESHAVLFCEGGNRPGDAAYLQNPQKMFYHGTTNMYFEGYNANIPNAREVLFNEGNFFHSTDPSSLVAWWDGPNVELRWDWDLKFSQRGSCSDPFSVDHVQRYRLRRYDSQGDSVVLTDSIVGATAWTDTPPDPAGEYSYRVESLATEGIHQGEFLEFTPSEKPVTAVREDGPHFFHRKIQVQEAYFHQRGCGTIGENDPISFSVQFGVDGELQEPDLASLELQVCYDYDPDPAHPFGPLFYPSERFEFSLVEGGGGVQVDIQTTLAEILQTGGFAYRLVYLSDSGETRYLPAEQGRSLFFWSSINNRVMACTWSAYLMKINGQAWRETSLATLQALYDGISFGNRPVQAFPNVFMDSALGSWGVGDNGTQNRIRPCEYTTSDQYYQDTISHLAFLNANAPNRMYINTPNNRLVEDLAPLGSVAGFMVENPSKQGSLTEQIIRSIWRVHAFPDKVELILEGGDHLGLAGEDGGIGTRKQCLATYLMAMPNAGSSLNATPLFGYGVWKDSDHEDEVILFPEQMLNIVPGDDILPPPTGWPSGGGIQAVTDELGAQWISDNLPAQYKNLNGRRFVWRRNELQDSAGNTLGSAWVVVDVEPNPDSSSPSGTYTIQDFFDGNSPRNDFYVLQLENEKALLTEGGTLTTTHVDIADEIYSEPGWVTIFFDVPIHSPVVHPRANHVVSIGSESVLDVTVETWDGQRLSSFSIDGEALGFSGSLELTDPDGDGIYSGTCPEVTGDTRTLNIPFIAVGNEGLRQYGTIEVVVAPLPVLPNKSDETGQLDKVGNLPWAATTLNVGDDLNNPSSEGFGQEDLLVTVQEEDESDIAWVFRHDFLQGGVPSFVRVDNIFVSGQLPTSGHRGVAVADFDNDGFEDLLVTHEAAGKTRLYRWNSDLGNSGLFEDALLAGKATVEGGFPPSNYAAAWGDYNQDGYLDLFLARFPFAVDEELAQLHNPVRATSASMIYQGSPQGDGILFSPVAADVLPGSMETSASLSMNWQDIDGDDDLDIIYTSFFGGGLTVLINSGYPDYSYTDQTATWMPDPAYSLFGSTLADLDNDGLPDLVVSSIAPESQTMVFRNDGPGQGFRPVNTAADLGITDWTTVSVGDLDLNGSLDLVAAPYYGNTDPPMVLLNGLKGEGFDFLHHPGENGMDLGGRSALVVHDWGDDGDLDLYMPHDPEEFGQGGSFFFLNGQDAANSAPAQDQMVRVCVIGSRSGGVGARVSIQDGPGQPTQTAYARVSEGRGGQSSRILVFGVPWDTDGVVSGTVTWPNGEESTHTFTVGEALNFVSQAEQSSLTSGTVTAWRNVGPEGTELQFNFVAAFPLSHLKVELDFSGTTSPCACGETGPTLTLDENSPEVRIEVTRLGERAFRHTLTVVDWCCVNYCDYLYTLAGSYGEEKWNSGQQSFSTSVCGKKIPTLPED